MWYNVGGMIELVRKKVQELNVILAKAQRETRGTPVYDLLDEAMDILNGDIKKALNEPATNNNP